MTVYFSYTYDVQNNTNRALYLILKCIWKGVGLILVHIQSCYEDNNHPSMSGQYTFMILSKVLKNMYNLWCLNVSRLTFLFLCHT